jgi:hypothetical protein
MKIEMSLHSFGQNNNTKKSNLELLSKESNKEDSEFALK